MGRMPLLYRAFPPLPGRARISTMITVDAAQAVVLDHIRALDSVQVALADALGMVLAEDVASDLDMPPFDKAMMDGYAVRTEDLASGKGTLKVIEEIPAG